MSDLDHHMNELNYLMRSPEPVSRSLGLEQKHDFSNGNGSGSSRVGAFHIARRDLASTPSGHLQEAIKAVEIAESAIMEQIEENELLKSELHLTNLELQSYKKEVSLRTTDEKSQQVPQSFGKFLSRDNHSLRDSLNVSMLNKEQPESQLGDDLQRKLVIHHSEYNNHTSSAANMSSSRHDSGKRVFSNDATQVNRCLSSRHITSDDCLNYSQISSPSSRPASPKRAQREGDSESRQTLPGQGKTQTPDVCNRCNPWKEDLILKVKCQEEEILRLRKRLSDNAIKARGRGIETELKILNEKHILEKRIAAMRMAFDQQQQDLVDAASKALSYRQDIMEENIRLTYSLQDAEQERSIFISSLLPLLDEYDFRPSVNDAHSIVSNVKVLIQHLHEKLNHSEAKVKDSQFQLTTWRSDPVYQTQYAPQSPIYGGNDHMPKLNPNCLEIVPQSGYAHGQTPASPQPQSPYNGGNWESAVVKYQPINDSYQGLANDEARQTSLSPVVGLDNKVLRAGLVSATGEMNSFFSNDEATSTSGQASSDNEFEDTREIGARSPCLPTVQEEPNSSVSGGEDDLMPAIENLQIVGDALPGHTLQACGLSINGTSVCIFQWVRHLEDGSMHYIEGAAQPEYTVTADDVDALVAIECFPMDDRGRKGDLVKVFVNDENKVTGGKISCDAAMRRKIESYFNVRLAVFDVQLSVGSFDIWEAAVLTFKKSSYEIKATKRRVVVNEKYSPDLQITIPSGSLSECVIICSDGREFVLATPEDNQLRDIIVLTLRLFMKQALERRKGKKVSFLNKIVSG